MGLGVLLVLVAGFGAGALFGAPYVPLLKRDSQTLLDLAELKPGQTLVDLGSGDGRFLRAAAQRGIRAIGFEINPLLWLISLVVCWPYRRLVTIRLADFWRVQLPETDAVYVFLIERYMAKLDRKLTREARRPLRLVSYVFSVPGKKPIRANKNSYVYAYKKS